MRIVVLLLVVRLPSTTLRKETRRRMRATVRDVIEIERVGPAAADRVRTVRLRALRDAPDAFWTTVEEEEARPVGAWGDRLARADVGAFLAVHRGCDVGLAWGEPHHDDPADAGVYGVWVDPAARGTGAGAALIGAVAAWASDRGHATLRLDVGDANLPAIRLYDRLGFTPTGRTERFPPPRDHIAEHERALPLRPSAPPAAP